VLGWFRQRKLTWLLFPVTSVAFTVATVLIADHFLGLRDQRRSLIVVDLARDGSALRWNRYEMVFAARDKQSVNDLSDSLWANLDVRKMNLGTYYPSGSYNPYNRRTYPYNQGYGPTVRPPGYGFSGEEGRETAPPLYEGVLPVHFQTREPLRQWRPEMNRTFSFESPPAPLIPNWRTIEDAWPDLNAVRARLSEKKPFNGDVYAISGLNGITADSGSRGILPLEILQGLCLGETNGLLSLVSQVSPTGGANFEDVLAMDSSSNDSLLAIVTQRGDDIVVYRRFFYGK